MHDALGIIEQGDDGACKARELTQHSNDWLVAPETGFVERYIRGALDFGLVPPALGEQANYGFVVYADICADRRKRLAQIASPSAHNNGLWTDGGLNEPLVLSRNVETMEGPKQVIPSLVRLERFDFGSFGLGKPLYEFSTFVPTGQEHLFGRGDGKIRIVGLSYAVADGKRIGQNVETAPDRIEISSSFDHEAERKKLFFDRHYNVIRNLRIGVFKNHVDILVQPGMDAIAEGWQLGYGPVSGSLSV